MKRLVTIALALMMTAAAACAGATTIGICQLVQHAALDEATRGFKDALAEKMPDAVIDEKNASGDAVNCATIVNTFVSDGVDLIMCNATPALQAAVAATGDIPILATSVTEYGVALGIDDFSGVTGMNVSGTSDLAPLAEQAAMVQELFPDAKKVGLLFCSAEANSIYQVKVVAEELAKLGYESEEFAFTDSNDVASVAALAAQNADVVYIPTDNTAAAYSETIANELITAGVPAIVGEEGACKGCGVATLTISYYDIGYATGLMACEILQNGADVSQMPIEYAPQFVKKYNAANAEALGITLPEGYTAIE